MATPLGILPHTAFRDMVEAARFDTYRRDPRSRVTNAKTFTEMKAHVATLYEGVDVQHSFEDTAGAVFDCIPVGQQISLRGHTGDLPQPPDLTPILQGRPPSVGTPPVATPDGGSVDRHGNVRQAPPGTIPVRRITLQELTRFRDLDDFYRKYPHAGAASSRRSTSKQTGPSAPDPDPAKNHRYAYTHQTVNSLGGHSSLAVYAPSISSDQVFSLAQHWYTGGAGNSHQTVEVGWQVYPTKYGHAQPVLFIFWTPDNYATGSYNLDGAGFVQLSGQTAIGSSLSPVSVQGGQQMEIEIAAYLTGGNWWIYVGGTSAASAVGYYPTSLFSGGAMATQAAEILYGGETVTLKTSWPAMGSGADASTGYGQAAYQRNIFYFPPGGGAQWAGLTPEQPSPGCYTLQAASAAAPWGTYFFYGGAGGGDC